jgi:beta-glucanase (GH16 family)
MTQLAPARAMLVLAALSFLNTCHVAKAFWTVDCGIVTVEKSDPIVFFGQENPHTHVVAGSAAFGPNATNADLRGQDVCTSCDVQQDKSAYWTNQLFVAPPDAQGMSEDGIRNMGGVPLPTKDGNAHIVYYKLITRDGEKSNNDPNAWETIVPFPEDFEMKVTEAMIREKQKTAANVFDSLVTYKCLGFGDQMDTTAFPADPSQCTGGLRAQLTMPSCWNGQAATNGDPSSHVAYPVGSWAGSPCPESHPTRLPTLFYEVLYDVSSIGQYVKDGWVLQYPLNERSESGDPLFHADFMNGWDQEFLQRALNECGVTPCPLIKKEFSACIKNPDENTDEPTLPPSTPPKACRKTRRTSKTWELLFSDEFDGDALDMTKWSFDLGDGCQYGICAWGNDEFQYYTNSTKNAYLKDGKLVIHSRLETGEDLDELRNFCRAQCVENYGTGDAFDQAAIDTCAYKCDYQEISSARLTTKNKFDFAPTSDPDGYKLIKVDAKLRTTSGDGLWPAHWALPTNAAYGTWAASGEIDFYESANDQSLAHGTIHYGGQWPGNTFSGKTTRSSAGVWHRITFYWDECSMRWRLDGRQFSSAKSGSGSTDGWYSVPVEGLANTPNAPFDQTNPFHLLFNQAVGGRFTGSVPYLAASQTLRENPLALFEVDWVRVYGMR